MSKSREHGTQSHEPTCDRRHSRFERLPDSALDQAAGGEDYGFGADFGGGDFGFGAADFGAADYGAADFGAPDYGAADYGAADYGVADFGAADVGGEIGASETGSWDDIGWGDDASSFVDPAAGAVETESSGLADLDARIAELPDPEGQNVIVSDESRRILEDGLYAQDGSSIVRTSDTDFQVVSADGQNTFSHRVDDSGVSHDYFGQVTDQGVVTTERTSAGDWSQEKTYDESGNLTRELDSFGNGGRTVERTYDSSGDAFETEVRRDEGLTVNRWTDSGGTHEQTIDRDGNVSTRDVNGSELLTSTNTLKSVTADGAGYETVITHQSGTKGVDLTTGQDTFKVNGAHIEKTTNESLWGSDTTTRTEAAGRVVTESASQTDFGPLRFGTSTTTIVEDGNERGGVQQLTVGASVPGIVDGDLTVTAPHLLSPGGGERGHFGISTNVETLGGYGPGGSGEVAVGPDRTGFELSLDTGLVGKPSADFMVSRDPVTDAVSTNGNVSLSGPKWAGSPDIGVGFDAGTVADETRVVQGSYGSLEGSGSWGENGGRIGAGYRTDDASTSVGLYGSASRDIGDTGQKGEVGGGITYDTKSGVDTYWGAKVGQESIGRGLPQFDEAGVPGKNEK